MSAAPKLETAVPDPFTVVRAVKKMRQAGFVLSVRDGRLIVSPFSRLSDPQRAWLRAHKAALVALLSDADALAHALVEAGPAGLDWREGTPTDWSDDRLLAAGEVLYSDGRMVNVLGRRYRPDCAPAILEGPEYPRAEKAPESAPYAATGAFGADIQPDISDSTPPHPTPLIRRDRHGDSAAAIEATRRLLEHRP